MVPPLPYSMEELQPKQDLQAERPLKRHIIIMVCSQPLPMLSSAGHGLFWTDCR